MSDTVIACPECDSTQLDRITTHPRINWTCRECLARFRSPVKRPPKIGGDHSSGLARKLIDMDLERVADE